MHLRDPVILAFFGSVVATVAILIDRRLRSRLTALDTWAQRSGLQCERLPQLAVLAPFEPLALCAPVVAVERLVRGTLRTPRFAVEVHLAACLTGNRHRPRRQLIGIFASHPELPPLRVLPRDDGEAPKDLGFQLMPASALPEGYQAEGFSPLSRPITQALGEELVRSGPGWRVELRPGRLILATSTLSVEQLDAMMGMGLRLQQALLHALTPPPEGNPPGTPSGTTGTPSGNRGVGGYLN